MKKISIIIPVYNVEKYVEKCLLSCAEQDLPSDEYEIIIINDGSNDNSLEIVERVSMNYSNIKIFSQKNLGLSAARNKGLSFAKGEYIWFVDSDDWIAENCLKKIVDKCFDNNLDIFAICASNIIDNLPERRFIYKIPEVLSGKDVLKNYNLQVCSPFSICRKQLLNTNNLMFYEGIFHEDSEFTPRMYYYADRVAFCDDICYFVNQNPNSITRSINFKKAFDYIKVAKSLSCFSQKVSKDCKDKFNYLISMDINNALANTYYMTKNIKSDLNKYIYNNRFLFKHLLLSKVIKYKLEGALFIIFPKYTVQVYQLIQKINNK